MAFWSKKKKEEGLPDLPPIPVPPQENEASSAQELEEFEESDVHPLPTFPESPLQKGFSQAAIKEAVSTEPETEELKPSAQSRTLEMEEEIISAPPIEEFQEVEEIKIKPAKIKNDVYIKVDRFVSARKALENSQIKLEEISELLKTIRETKMREEQELTYLEKELSATKARVQEITENIFEKV